jgi:hypothetical protein
MAAWIRVAIFSSYTIEPIQRWYYAGRACDENRGHELHGSEFNFFWYFDFLAELDNCFQRTGQMVFNIFNVNQHLSRAIASACTYATVNAVASRL